MKILHDDDGKKGVFYIGKGNDMQAQMTYVWVGTERIIIDHTEVIEILKGKNIGKQLIKSAVEFARERKIRIIPLCPFARSVFEKVQDYKDVL